MAAMLRELPEKHGYRRLRFPIGPLLACALGAAAVPLAAHADRISDFEAGVAYDNNLSNGSLRGDTHGDLAVTAATSQGVFIPVGDFDSATLTGNLRAQSYDRFSGMNNLSLGTTLSYRKKFGLGLTAPAISASLSAARLDFQNDIRSGWQYNAACRFSQRLDERWSIGAELAFDKRTDNHGVAVVPGISGDVFKIDGRNASVNAEYAWDDKTSVSLAYGYRSGDVVSTTRPNFAIFRASAAIVADPVFGLNEFAYRLHAVSQLASLHFSRALNGNSSLNLGLQRQYSRGEGGNNYGKNIVELSYLYSF
jgi:hypothetical protein